MATKFVHEGGVRASREAVRTPYRRVAQRGRPPRGAKGVVWAAGIGLVAVLLVFMSTLYERPGPRQFAPRRGTALIVDKLPESNGRWRLELRVADGGPRGVDVYHTVDGPQAEALEPGDRVALLYRIDRQGRTAEVVDVGRFALPDDMQ